MKKRTVIIGMMLLAGVALAGEAAKDLVLPQAIPDLIDWLLSSKTASVVKYASVITMVTQIVKTAWVLFGSKIPAKLTAGVVGIVGLATLADQVVAAGGISGSDWSAIAVSVVSTVLAFFGYKVMFSKDSKVQADA